MIVVTSSSLPSQPNSLLWMSSSATWSTLMSTSKRLTHHSMTTSREACFALSLPFGWPSASTSTSCYLSWELSMSSIDRSSTSIPYLDSTILKYSTCQWINIQPLGVYSTLESVQSLIGTMLSINSKVMFSWSFIWCKRLVHSTTIETSTRLWQHTHGSKIGSLRQIYCSLIKICYLSLSRFLN